MSTPAIQTRHWTREEYDRLVAAGVFHPEERLELVQGEILQMSPQGTAHATAVSLVEQALRQAFGEGYVLRIQMPLALDPHSEPEPDIAIVVGSPRDYRETHPRTAALIAEIADTTLQYDREQKSNLYALAAIQEYWIVNLIDRQIEVYRKPTGNTIQSATYQSHSVKTASDTIAPLTTPHVSFTVSDLLP